MLVTWLMKILSAVVDLEVIPNAQEVRDSSTAYIEPLCLTKGQFLHTSCTGVAGNSVCNHTAAVMFHDKMVGLPDYRH